MKILVTGSNGQLGREFRRLSPGHPEHEFVFTDLPELDITDNKAIGQFVDEHKPQVVINCAAYTAVDKAETEQETAFLVNGTAPGYLASNCTRTGALFIHISTDYIFDGNKNTPYTENDSPNPQSIYAKSKYEGELAVLKHALSGIIIRTSWLYSEFMNNFVKTILNKGAEKGQLNVVYDQTGCPTWSKDLAVTILAMIASATNIEGVKTYHYSNEGVTTWYDFALAIVEFSGIRCKISPILTEQYPLPAVRPVYSVMHKAKIREEFGIEIPHWRESLKECVNMIMNYGLRITKD